MSSRTIRVLIVDDHAIVREGYRSLLAKHEGITVVGEASDAASAYQCYKDKQPDVVIMDISMPGRGGIDAIKHIREFDAHAASLSSNVACSSQAGRNPSTCPVAFGTMFARSVQAHFSLRCPQPS